MTGVTGIGWIDGSEYGQVRAGSRVHYANQPGLDRLWQDRNIFQVPVKNYGRFNAAAKLTCCACALAMSDSEHPHRPDTEASPGAFHGRTIGILGSNRDGCLDSNVEYFKDYVDCGRTLSRGNLFIYTLPSSPLAEAAIHLGLTGPTLYIAGPQPDAATIFRTAARMVAQGDADAMLAVQSNETEAACFVIAEYDPAQAMCGLDDALAIVENTDCTRIGTLVNGFTDM